MAETQWWLEGRTTNQVERSHWKILRNQIDGHVLEISRDVWQCSRISQCRPRGTKRSRGGKENGLEREKLIPALPISSRPTLESLLGLRVPTYPRRKVSYLLSVTPGYLCLLLLCFIAQWGSVVPDNILSDIHFLLPKDTFHFIFARRLSSPGKWKYHIILHLSQVLPELHLKQNRKLNPSYNPPRLSFKKRIISTVCGLYSPISSQCKFPCQSLRKAAAKETRRGLTLKAEASAC